jgi:hypothetical protein
MTQKSPENARLCFCEDGAAFSARLRVDKAGL